MTSEQRTNLDCVDPFIGHAATDLPEQGKLSATWWWPKAQVGNTHPGPTTPFGMVSAVPYSGAYPTGYGLYTRSTDGSPGKMHEEKVASGITHFQQSGPGDMRVFYNYFRVTPLRGTSLSKLGTHWPLQNEAASPGYYRTEFGGTGITAEVTCAPRAAMHRYSFEPGKRAAIALDVTVGGVNVREPDRVIRPNQVELRLLDDHRAEGFVRLLGIRYFFHLETNLPVTTAATWVNARKRKGRELIRAEEPTLMDTMGLVFESNGTCGGAFEFQIGFSFQSTDQARENFSAVGGKTFDDVRSDAEELWATHLGKIDVEGGTETQRRIFYTSFYHSCIKPCDLTNESPFWLQKTPFFTDLSTMWDIYKTQIPLVLSLFPETGKRLIEAFLEIGEHHGHFPIGYVLDEQPEKFSHQCSAITHLCLYDAFVRRYKGIDWLRVLDVMLRDLRTGKGEAFQRHGYVHPFTHTLDLADACSVTAQIAHAYNRHEIFERMQNLAERWRYVYNDGNGRLGVTGYYEGGLWNYSFRLHYDMMGRIRTYPKEENFVADLDTFFGYGKEPCKQLGYPPDKDEEAAGYALNRFTGLNNEPDMETMYAYVYAGRHDRSAEVVREIMQYQFTDQPGGLPGNDDSGALSSWYVWSAIGLFPVAGQDLFLIGSPIFERSTVHLEGGDFIITARHVSEANKYISHATLNGRPLPRAYLRWAELSEGGELELHMAPHPSDWAREKRPFTRRMISGFARTGRHEPGGKPAPFPYSDF